MASTPEDPLRRLAATFQDQPLAAHGGHWDKLWREEFTPWDRGEPSPALDGLLATVAAAGGDVMTLPASSRTRKKALVPGCGHAYDVLLLAAWGYDVYGLDFSAQAIARAAENEKAVSDSGDERYALREGAVAKGTVTWLVGDFFKDDFVAEAGVGEFDLIYDYTFFCALPPSGRPRWARRMSRLLSRDGGRLVCLEWPSIRSLSEQGPPWGVTSALYLAHLSHPGESIPYEADGSVVVDRLGSPDAVNGLQRLLLITPSQTHKSGQHESGKVHDRLSVWGHSSSVA